MREKDKCAIFRENCAPLNAINARGYTQICVQRGRAVYDQDGYNYLISSMREYIFVFIIKTQSLIAIKSKSDRDRTTDRKRRQNLAKCCSVSLQS